MLAVYEASPLLVTDVDLLTIFMLLVAFGEGHPRSPVFVSKILVFYLVVN